MTCLLDVSFISFMWKSVLSCVQIKKIPESIVDIIKEFIMVDSWNVSLTCQKLLMLRECKRDVCSCNELCCCFKKGKLISRCWYVKERELWKKDLEINRIWEKKCGIIDLLGMYAYKIDVKFHDVKLDDVKFYVKKQCLIGREIG